MSSSEEAPVSGNYEDDIRDHPTVGSSVGGTVDRETCEPITSEFDPIEMILPQYPSVLTFFSHWNRSVSDINVTENAKIEFDGHSGDFRILANKKYHVFDALSAGRRYRPWDLFVGLRIRINGRLTTLQRADTWTREWLDKATAAAYQSHVRVENILRKFEVLKSENRVNAKTAMALTLRQPLGGTLAPAIYGRMALEKFQHLRRYREVDIQILNADPDE